LYSNGFVGTGWHRPELTGGRCFWNEPGTDTGSPCDDRCARGGHSNVLHPTQDTEERNGPLLRRLLGADGRYHEEGGYKTEKEAAKIAAQRELEAARGDWASPMAGRTTFADYVTTYYWPTTEHLEVSTRTAYRYYLDKHFIPRFGKLPMRRISPTMIQAWVNEATRDGLSARSAVKYHALLHKVRPRGHRRDHPGQSRRPHRVAEW
jgi:hypothetical protein